MKKFTPSILIWNLELCDKQDGTVLQNLYFLSYKRAKKFLGKPRSRTGRIQREPWWRITLVVVNKMTILRSGNIRIDGAICMYAEGEQNFNEH